MSTQRLRETMEARLNELREEMEVRNIEAVVAVKRRIAAEDAYATEKAESVGVRLGSVVTVTSRSGYKTPAKYTTKRYRVTRIKFCGYRQNELTLFGVTIRKDGTDGETVEIWSDWEIETVAA